MQIQASKKTWINLSFRFESPEGFWMFNFFLHSLSIKKKQQRHFFVPEKTDFWCQGYNVGCNKLGNWPFPTYDTHFEGGIWPLGLLGPGMRCTPSCKGPPAHLRSISYMSHEHIWKQDVFWKKKGGSAQNISPLSHNGETFWTKNHWCFAPKVSCDEPLDLSLRYEGCKIYNIAHVQNKTMSFLHLVLIAALECLPESSDDA